MEIFKSLCFLFLFFSFILCQNKIDLGGTWTVTNSNSSIKINGTVPGYIHMDLLNAGKSTKRINIFIFCSSQIISKKKRFNY